MAKNGEEIKKGRTFPKYDFFEFRSLILKRRYFFAECAFSAKSIKIIKQK